MLSGASNFVCLRYVTKPQSVDWVRPGKTPYKATANLEIRSCVKQDYKPSSPKRSRSPTREVVVSKDSSYRALNEKVFWCFMPVAAYGRRSIVYSRGGPKWRLEYIYWNCLLKLSVVYTHIMIWWLLVIFRHNGGPLPFQLRAVVGTIRRWSFKQSWIISDG